MKQYCIAGVNIELDTEKTYFDFYIQGGEPKLVEVGLESICKSLQSGEIPVDDDFKEYLSYLKRWETDAPRKRGYRKMRADGFTILSSEYFFDSEGGEEIINNLENTGIFAAYLMGELFWNK